MPNYFVSICIPSYNRPREVKRLLQSIDCSNQLGIQLVICEDQAPKRDEVRAIVEEYTKSSKYDVKYIENEVNYGYDKNLRELIMNADGEYVIFMGDDDLFIPGELDNYLLFISKNKHLGYILRSYKNTNIDGKNEQFIYYPKTKFFDLGEEAYVELFRKSVFISGFTFKREYALPSLTDIFDGTLLYQLYIMAEICLHHASAYYCIPFTQSIDEGGKFYFGTSDAEKDYRTPGEITIKGEIKFISSFAEITRYIDNKYGTNSTSKLLEDMSKYSYPILEIMRNKGIKEFSIFAGELKKIGLGCTVYFYLYFIGLALLGNKNCRMIIREIKKIYGRTPRL